MCGARSCTVVLCHIRTEISVKLFDRGTVWEVMYVGLGNLASFDYRNHMFWKWPLCPPSGGVDVRYVHWGHLVELLSYPDRVIHSTSCPPKEGKSSFQDHCVFSHQRIITFSQLAALFFFFAASLDRNTNKLVILCAKVGLASYFLISHLNTAVRKQDCWVKSSLVNCCGLTYINLLLNSLS